MELWRGDRRKVWEREEVWLIKTWPLRGQNNWTKWNTNTLNNNDKHNSIQFLNLELLNGETGWSTWSGISCETTVSTSCWPKYWKNIIKPACMQIPPLFFLAPSRVSYALIYCIVFVQLIKVMLLHQNYFAQPSTLWANQSACMNYWLKCSRLTAWHLHTFLERITMTEMKNTGREHMCRLL